LLIVIILIKEIQLLPSDQNRMTRQRKVILEELKKVTTHPTADEVYEMVRKTLPRISLGTVYRNLETLTEFGLIQKIEVGTSQKRFDGDIDRHFHVKCVSCEKVFDLPQNQVKEPAFQKDVVEGVQIVNYSLHFTGICDTCSTS